MESLLNLLLSEKRHWLTTPRFAAVTWPMAAAGVLATAGYQLACLPFLFCSALATLRLTVFRLLPHEKSRLHAAHKARMNADPEAVIAILNKPALFQGTHFKLQKACIGSMAYVDLHRYQQAHAQLNGIDRRALLPDEQNRLAAAWARLFLETGNVIEAARPAL
jgi:hypothetical protein